jgi:hypothetical protein
MNAMKSFYNILFEKPVKEETTCKLEWKYNIKMG